jgi:ABC-type phosphate transport system substrate-binding protein
MTQRILRTLCVAAIATVLTVAARPAAAQISVIVSSATPKTADETAIAEIFAGASTTWPDGTKVQIVENGDAVLTQKFFAKVVKKPTALVRSQWTKLALSGQGAAPKKGRDAAAVKALVAATPGAIGYIPSDEVDGSVKEILKVP